MPNPAIIPCPADAWTKVATNVTTGQIHRLSVALGNYLQTYRLTGEAAPSVISEGVSAFVGGQSEVISNTEAIDIYIYPVRAAGSVRVDL